MNPLSSSISRRGFLARAGAGVGAGLVLGAPSILRAANADGSDKIHVALVGMGKQGSLKAELGEDVIDVMRDIKKLFDPDNLMNPGKVVSP